MGRPSKAEQKLIDFSKEAFGEHLSELLLSGYGEQHTRSSRDFAVELAEGKTDTPLHLIFVSEGPATTQISLPRGKEPLVLLALLQLLMKKRGDLIGKLSYKPVEVLKLLRWGNTTKAELTFADAVTKYFHSFYQLNGSMGNQSSKATSDSALKLRLISCHGFSSGDRRKAPPDFVTFNPDFVERLQERKLLGIDWDMVKAFTPLPAEFFNQL
jgi:hypothetical protein